MPNFYVFIHVQELIVRTQLDARLFRCLGKADASARINN